MLLRAVFFVVLCMVAAHVLNTLYLLGYFKTIYKHYPGHCRVVPGVDLGSEDVTVTSDGLAFISSGLRGFGNKSDPLTQPPLLKGRIFLFDFNHPEKNAVEIALEGDFDRENFYPLGISLYEDSTTGEKKLFVINNHISNENRVEIFRFDERTSSLHHLKTIIGETLYSLNDLVAVGPETFYYINYMYFTKQTPLAFKLETYSGLAWGTIGLYSEGKDMIISSGYRIPVGINVSPDGRHLYVSTSLTGELVIFERGKDDSITEIKRVSLHTSPDNIEVDRETGDLWIGCIPSLHLHMAHLENYANPGTSQVLRLRFGDQNSPFENIDVREVLMDDGSLIKGSSVASYYDNKMLVGTVVHKLAYCELSAF
ncbi:serum paraoxonase/arylesterase 1-like isoform X1 [Ptychodera flava]|uniref:serum paraoxonase/arylesterase 1-like isoform X1 n=1 Tax=Ptychodera flava TaxID=63121 RepID=UPI00396A6CF0